MPDRQSAKRIFMAALDLDPAERPAFIAAQCKGDAALQREVEDLLAAHEGKPILDPATLPAQPANHASQKSKNIAGSARPGEEIGPYRLLERIGEGGFGEVWIAEQKTPVRRKVALKIIKAGMDTREVLARFEAERQALAVMDHPNVAKVFDAGATAGGRPYFVMEHVAGLPINAYCDSSRLRIKERLRLFMDICHAVQHAHQKGIIHRDLKPGNIIVTLQDGKPVPKVIDFGIAKATIGRLTERTLYTETGRVIGTPEYMAPEQAGTSGLDVDTRADIYSLGVILYELLTGTLPLDGQTLRSAGFEAIGKMLKEFEPPKPSTRLSTMATEPVTRGKAEPDSIAKTHGTDLRTLQRELRGDLDWITLKALEKDRSRRYETASAFAADVDRHLTGEPVIAAPPSVGYRLRKFVKKHKAGAIIAATLVLATITTSSVSFWAISERAQKEMERDRAEEASAMEALAREDAEIERHRADRRRDDAQTQAYIANIRAAQLAMSLRDWPEARLSLDACDPNARGWEWELFKRMTEAVTIELPGAICAVFSSDGRFLVTGSQNGTARMWDVVTGNPIGEVMRHDAEVVTVDINNDCTRILTASYDKKVRLWDVATGQQVGKSIIHGREVESAVFSPDEEYILTTGDDSRVLVWDAASAKLISEIKRGVLRSPPAISSDSQFVLTAFADEAYLWETVSGKQIGEPIGIQGKFVGSVKFSPDNTLILINFGRTARIFDSRARTWVGRVIKHDGAILSEEFSPNGNLLLTASSDKTARLWNSSTGEQIGEAMKHSDTLSSATFSHDGRRIATIDFGGLTRLWNLDCVCLAEASVGVLYNGYAFPSVSFSPDDRTVLVNTCSSLRLMPIRNFDSPTRPIIGDLFDLEISSFLEINGQERVSSRDITLATRNCIRNVVLGPEPCIRFLAKLSDQNSETSQRGATSLRKGEIARVDFDKQPIALFSSPDGTRIAIQFEDNTALLWDTREPDARQAARDARLAERRHATELVDALLGGPMPLGRIEPFIHKDNTIKTLRKLLALEVLREQIAAIESSVQQEFDKVIAECITPARAESWIRRLRPLPNDSTPLARRIREGLEKRIVKWKPDAVSLNNVVWAVVRKPDSPPERIAAAIEAASMLLGMNPDDGESLKNLGAAQYRSGKFDIALESLANAVSSFKKDGKPHPNALSFIAMCQLRLGRREEALSVLLQLQKQASYRLYGNLAGRRSTVALERRGYRSSLKELGAGWFELSQDGRSFRGQYRLYGDDGTWQDWTGSRKSGFDLERIDGLWSTRKYDLWLTTIGNEVIGMDALKGPVLEAVELYESAIAASATANQPATSQPASITTSQPTSEQSPASQLADPPSIPSPTTQPTSK